MRLREKLLLPVFIIVVAGMATAISYLYTNSAETISLEIQNNIENEVNLSVRLVNTWLEGRITDFNTWKMQQLYHDALTETGNEGRLARAVASTNLMELERGYPYYDYLFMADASGNIIAESSPDGFAEFNKNIQTLLAETMKGNTSVSSVLTSEKTDIDVFIISVPVYCEGKVNGALAGAVDVAEFRSLFIDAINPGRNGFLCLAEQDGSVFIKTPEDHPVITIASLEYADNILLQKGGMLVQKVGGDKQVACFKKVDKTGWIFLESKSLDVALIPIAKTKKYSVLTAVMILLIILMTVSILFKKIIHVPLEATLKVIKEIDKGNLDQHISVKQKGDEIGIMINAFNDMIERLRGTLENLTREVEERKTAEHKLAQHRDNLETLARDRTRELEKEHNEKKQLEARLHLSEKMEAIGTLAGGVAHDLNNILSGVLTYPELILMDLDDDHPLRPQLETIHTSGKKAAAIVQDLLTLARRGVHVEEISNINALVYEYLESPDFEKMLSFHPGVRIKTDLEETLYNTTCSSVHLEKTLLNLVSNAAEAMPEGGTLTITTQNRHMESPVKGYEHIVKGKYALLEISDTGVGISETDIRRIYEPFYTKKQMRRSGTGLGMAVVWGTVKDHKGYIVCDSEEGRGTTFTLYFPCSDGDIIPVEENFYLKKFTGAGETVLIVDDVKEQREIASAIVRRIGYTPVSVESGENALEYLEANNTDIILLDMVMDPGMDGLETYERIVEMNPNQKAVIASGFSETERVQKALELGVGSHIKKPYSIGVLSKALKEELMK